MNIPDHDDVIQMFKSGKFGIEHPFKYAPMEFCLEYAFDEFNEVFDLVETQEDWEEKSIGVKDWNIFQRAQDEPWANLVFTVWVDKTFAPFVSRLDRNEFIHFTDRKEELIHEQTRSIVFDFKYSGILKENDPFYSAVKDSIQFTEMETKGKTIFHYGIWIATADLYDEFSNKNNLEKRKSLRNVKVPWDGSSSYIVYIAKDKEGIVRYVGEGKPERYLHVNSGVSHNYRINEHYFLNGEMQVDILRDQLTKPKALAVEKFLISRYQKTLWNIRDNPSAKIS